MSCVNSGLNNIGVMGDWLVIGLAEKMPLLSAAYGVWAYAPTAARSIGVVLSSARAKRVVIGGGV